MTGGITTGNRQFTYRVFFEAPQSKVQVKDEDGKEHTFYFTELRQSYRELIIKELKRIGWISGDD